MHMRFAKIGGEGLKPPARWPMRGVFWTGSATRTQAACSSRPRPRLNAGAVQYTWQSVSFHEVINELRNWRDTRNKQVIASARAGDVE